MNPKPVFVLLFSLLCQNYALCQDLVYKGTGVDYDGGHNSDVLNNQTVILGGLFAIHENENNECGHVRTHIIQLAEAMALTIARINNDTNFLPGITLAYEIRDTCIQPNYALEQTLGFITRNELTPVETSTNAGVSGVVGATFSSVSIAVASLLRLFRISQISYSSTAEILSDKTRFDYFFRTVPPDSLQAKAIASIIIKFNWTYVLAIHSDDNYGKGGIASLQNELQSFNLSSQVCLGSMPVSDSATRQDYSDIVDKINQEWVANSSVVVLFAHLNNAEGIFEAILQRQAVDAKFAERNITWIGSDSWGNNVPPRYNKIAHGLLSTIPQVNLSKKFDGYFLSLHPSKNNTRNPWFNEYWEEIFNCSLGAQKDVEPCDLENQARSRENGYRQNSLVPLVVDAVYAFAHVIHNMQKENCPRSEGLCPEILETQLKGRVIRGDLLRHYLHNVSFEGTSADRIEFDENGDQQGGYSIVNLQVDPNGSYSYINVGNWNKHRTTPLIIHGDIQWKHSLNSSDVPASICSQACSGGEHPLPVVNQAECCWICRQCEGSRQVSYGLECRECKLGFRPNKEKTNCVYIQPTFLTWSDPLAIIIIILSLLGIATTTFVTLVFVIYHNEHLIKASSRELSAVLLCGIMLCYLMPFVYIAKPSPASCAIQRFGVGFCFSLCFSALLVKTNRIHRIFNRKTLTLQAPPLVNPQSQLFFTALLVTVQVLITIVWLVVEQPNTVFLYNDFTTQLLCSENPYIGLSVTLAYNLLLLVVTTYFAFRTRKVPQNFNEAKFINLTVYTLCVLWLAFIPAYFVTTALQTSFHTGSLVMAIILSATVTLCCLLVPKVYFLFSRKRKGSSGYPTTMDTFGSPNNALPDKRQSSNKCHLVDAAIQTDKSE